MWKRNRLKEKKINKHGVTYGLPLFGPEDNLPDRIFDSSFVKGETYEKLKGKLSEARLKVFLCLLEMGYATDQEIAERLGWEINRVTPRRKELQELGFVQVAGFKTSNYGTKRTVWKVDDKWLLRLT